MRLLKSKIAKTWSSVTTEHESKPSTIMFYLYGGWSEAQGPPSGKQPWGLGHRSADWACSGDGVLSAAAPGTHWAGVLCTAGQQCYVQTQVPGMCMCYPPGSSDRPPPGTQTINEEHKLVLAIAAWYVFYICDIKPYKVSSTEFRAWLDLPGGRWEIQKG